MMNSGFAIFGICGLVAAIIVSGHGVGTGIWVGLLFWVVSMISTSLEIRCIKEEEIRVTRTDIPREEY